MVDGLSLKDKVAIVTGATKGIGRGISEVLAARGANIVIVSRSQKDCALVAAELRQYGIESIGIRTDVTKISEVEDLTRQVIDAFGHIDVLVNNAGSAITKKAELLTEEDWDRVLNIDLKAVFFCSQIIGREMIKQNGGKIINIASMLGLIGEKQVLPYCVAKGGVIQMTRALALEWARYNIQVNAICPGYVITPMNAAELSEEKIFKHITGKIPMKRLGEVKDIVGAAAFLASKDASYMTGQAITIDGGWTAQ